MNNTNAHFPITRMRRLRTQPWLRDMVCETRLNAADFIWPVFVIEGENERESIPSMPDVYRYSLDLLIEECKKAADLGIPAVALFPITVPSKKSENGQEAWNPDNLVCRAAARLKREIPHLGIITDVALDPYTSHGHDGILDAGGYVLNDITVDALCKQAVVQTKAGADIIAPSDMMDGRVGKIRAALDKNGYENTAILSYAAKYASAFYGPFRDAVHSSNLLKGDKKTYQMNPANSNEALREVALDLNEGADMVMVKPALAYLDIIARVKSNFGVPTFAYHVSGEYAMLRAAAGHGWIDYDKALLETMTAFKRAGADGILTYGAPHIAKILRANI